MTRPAQSYTYDPYGNMLDLLTRLEADGVAPGVFYTPQDKGVTPSPGELREAIEEELEPYE